MSERLREKAAEYEELLAAACETSAVIAIEDTGFAEAGEECLEMARAYLKDGRHFRSSDDLPNALAAFAYGHGWLDAGIRLGVLSTDARSENGRS